MKGSINEVGLYINFVLLLLSITPTQLSLLGAAITNKLASYYIISVIKVSSKYSSFLFISIL
jgi:hypothetical protein